MTIRFFFINFVISLRRQSRLKIFSMLQHLKQFIKNETRRFVAAVENNFPLFILLCLFMTIPAYFEQLRNYVNIFTVAIVAFSQSFVFSLILVRLAAMRKYLYFIILAVFSFLFFGELVTFLMQHSRINTTIMHFVLQTNPREVSEFISEPKHSSAIIKSLVIIALTLCFYLQACRLWTKKRQAITGTLRTRTKALIIAGVALLSVANFVIVDSTYVDKWMRHHILFKCSTPMIYKFIWTDVIENSNSKKLPYVERAIDNLAVTHSADSLNIIYIIGESHSKHHSSVYGYKHATTPNIDSMVRDSAAFVLNDVISHSCNTHLAFPKLISMHCLDDSDEWYNYPLIFSVFKRAGFKVSYISNQSVLHNHKYDFTHDFYFCRPGICEKSFDYRNDTLYTYDLDLVNNNRPTGINNFVVYHLMGQHFTYHDRYPSDESVFHAEDYEYRHGLSADERQIIAEYDNATRYNDLVIDSIIAQYKDTPAIVFYVSDHGEECYDFRKFYTREIKNQSLGALKFVYQVPAYIWTSEKFRSKYPDKVSRLRKAANRPLYNSDLVHTIVDVAEIESPTLDLRYSLLRDSIARPARKILDTIDYDACKDSVDATKMIFQAL